MRVTLTFFSISTNRVGLVRLLDKRPASLVTFGIFFSSGNHVLDVLFTKARRRSNCHRLILASSLVLGRNVDDTIYIDQLENITTSLRANRRLTSINVEGNLNLRNAFRCRWNANEVEIAK